MAEFLTTADISARLQKIIRESDDHLVLISPYLKTNPRIKELLEQKSRTGTHIRIIYGKKELQAEEQEWIYSNPHIELLFRQSLHAKCYLNEKEALLTSMNLYEFSEQNNDEMGVVVSNRHDNLGYDRALYRKIVHEAEQIADLSEKIREVPRTERVRGLGSLIRRVAKEALSIAERNVGSDGQDAAEEDSNPVARIGGQPNLPTSGFCIRCKAEVPTNLSNPHCDRCFRTWNRYKNEGFVERYCHICGKEHPTIRLKSLCSDCGRTYLLENMALSVG